MMDGRREVAQRILRAYLARNAAAAPAAEDVLLIIEQALNRQYGALDSGRESPIADPNHNPFPAWLTRERLSIRAAAQVLGASARGVLTWKHERPPRYVLLACAALSGGCPALPSHGEHHNPFPEWMDSGGLTMRRAAELLGISTSSIAGYRRKRPRLYVLLACAALSKGLAPIA